MTTFVADVHDFIEVCGVIVVYAHDQCVPGKGKRVQKKSRKSREGRRMDTREGLYVLPVI